VFGLLGYREAARFERQQGRGPFGVPPWGWAAITGFSLLIGAVLLAIARRRAGKAPIQVPVDVAPQPLTSSPYGATTWQPAPPSADAWAAPGPTPSVAPPPPAVPSTTSRDILPGR
jgi:hypothetical protein